MSLMLCSACSREVNRLDKECPFCGAIVTKEMQRKNIRIYRDPEFNLFSLVVGWLFGLLYFLLFLLCIHAAFLTYNFYFLGAGATCLIASMILLPPIRRYCHSKNKLKISWYQRLFIVCILHIIFVGFASVAKSFSQ